MIVNIRSFLNIIRSFYTGCAVLSLVMSHFPCFSVGNITDKKTISNKGEGCTTILVGKNATRDGSVILGHNEDMGTLSGRLLFQPRKTFKEKAVELNYVTIPQVPETYQYWASGNSKPVADRHYDGGWILCGMNQFGVSLGCNTMSTREERIPRGKGIMRYCIRQLILERSKSARDGVDLIGRLIDTFGQSDSPVAYCIADQNEVWLVETTYRHWVAKRIPDDGFHVIANQYTIESEWDLASDGLIEYAIEQGWYHSAQGSFNFKHVYNDQKNLDLEINTSRERQGRMLLRDKIGSITVRDVLEVLFQPPIQTTGTQAFMVYHLPSHVPREIGYVMWHGMSGANTSVAVPIFVASTRVPEAYTEASYRGDSKSAWWQFERLQKLLYPQRGKFTERFAEVRKVLDRFQENVFIEYDRVKKEALELWNRDQKMDVDDLLSEFTYDKLSAALSLAREAFSSTF